MIGRRRALLTLGATVLIVSTGTRASELPLVGFVNNQSLKGWERFISAFERGLYEQGFRRGVSVDVSYAWAEGDPARLPPLIRELLARQPAVIVATGGPDPALAAKAATSTVPIVFTTGADPVALGLVSSLSRPGGNLTGFTLLTRELNPKRLELLLEVSSPTASVAGLFNPSNTGSQAQLESLLNSALATGTMIHPVWVDNLDRLEMALRAARAAGAESIFVGSDSHFYANRARLIETIDNLGMPAIYEGRDFVIDGGLISYGVDFADVYRRAGSVAGRVLKGSQPADIPVEQPSKMELFVNRKTSQKLGLVVPPAVLLRADEVYD
jgi:putative tryptophan/tyrosine transport system substrate-binding protein